MKQEKQRSLKSTAASGMRGGGLSTQEGSSVRPCMFGSIRYVHVVNMKASILYAQQKQNCRISGDISEPALYSA